MLATGGFKNDVREELLKETGAGTYAVDIREIKAAIVEYYAQFKTSGHAEYAGNVKTRNYSYPVLSSELARVLDDAVSGHHESASVSAEGQKKSARGGSW